MSSSKYTIDMTTGSILRKYLLFIFPLFCTYALQTAFNAADMMIIGRFGSSAALAAIGATLNPITLMLKILLGLSTGTNAVVAMYYGAKDPQRLRLGTHTAMALSVFGGILLMAVALVITRPLLVLMRTPQDILEMSCRYMRICFLGVPFMMIFNFGCALLRAVGDTRRPLYYLTLSGLLNVLLNLLFVVVFRMSIAGVAIATAVSNVLAALLMVHTLVRSTDIYRIVLKDVRIHWGVLKEILWVGIPAAINSSFFNIANITIQSSVNVFGSIAIAGCAAASAIEAFVSVLSTAALEAAMTVTAQNYGAKKYPRVLRSIFVCIGFSALISLLIGNGFVLGGHGILGLFNSDPRVVEWGMIKLRMMLMTYFLGCIMDVTCGCLRGIGHPVIPAVASFAGACLFRISWVLWIYPFHPTLGFLMGCYPVSWVLVSTFNCCALWFLVRRLLRKKGEMAVPAPAAIG